MKVDEMISTVDRNNDGRISFSEFRYKLNSIGLPLNQNDAFRVMMGGFPLIIDDNIGKKLQSK